MKFKTKIVMTSIPVLMLMANATYAGTCTAPCNVDTTIDPNILLRDTSPGDQDWEIQNVGSGPNSTLQFGVDGLSNSFIIEDDAANNTLVVDDLSRVGIGTAAPGKNLEVASTSQPAIRIHDTTAADGHVDLVQQSRHFVMRDEIGTNRFAIETDGATGGLVDQLYLDNTGGVGIRQTNPSTDLVVGGNGRILMQNPGFGASTLDWGFWSGSGGMWVSRSNNNIAGGTNVMKFQNSAPVNSLVLNGTGVGMGTAFPTAALHVQKAGAVLRVEDTNGVTAVRSLLEMKNNGAVGFLMEDTDQAVQWEFRSNSTGNFIMNDVGDGAEVTVLRNGNMIVSGTVSEGSSREIKTDFDVIKTTDFMDKLSKVEVLEWRYKDSGKDDRHIGPISEDFYKLFKLGPDNKHISPRDVASIALLAAKELQKKGAATSAKLEAENAALKQQLNKKTTALKAESDKLQKRLASLEKLVTNLASSGNTLGEKGSNVAIK